ncbi:ATP-dependent DNA helicase RecG [Emcibacter sp. SYSU 3D8]|uniref:ATP-dependent DNA helicase RecG n=1 Tax=Emcibacter sp. SYSU 3D8 TaxID=3133969 RepID=UPI0031FECB22
MRPEVLFPLFKPVTSIPGVGPRMAKLVEKVAGDKVVDLCWHLPTGLIDRRFSPKVAEAPVGQVVTLTLQVDRHEKPGNQRSPYRVLCSDDTGFIALIFFSARDDYLRRILPEGATRVVSGTIEEFNGGRQMSHPDYVVSPEEKASIQIVEPVYPLTAGLSPKILTKAVRSALTVLPSLPEWLDRATLSRGGWSAWSDALRTAHSPEAITDLDPNARARQRLAYDELLANQLALALVRTRMRRAKGRPLKGTGDLCASLVALLPYQLTGAQKTAIAEILADLGSADRMLRLLQGDVGSGKTIVALHAMLTAVEEGAQAALLAPTEILARQHYETIRPFADALGIQVRLLTGRDKGKAREALLADLASGVVQLIVGTHALLQEDVAYNDLAVAVIDEQHRFGVHQRLTLSAKGGGPVDVMVMTATPIPRTLTLTAYGDMDVSRLTEKPPGRTPIDTRAVPATRMDEVVAGLHRAVENGAQAYWVCPLVEESEVLDVAAAEQRFAALQRQFGDRVGLLHGRMKPAEKDAVMARFSAGALSILVATTVIEVGVDVPNASIMVIEHAERFGLAQLHQLRGRVGRGSTRSSCILLYGSPLSETAQQRLKVIRDTDDGFVIAEEDLRLRGAGELLGTRQSGLPQFRLADVEMHGDLLRLAREDATAILKDDPALNSRRGEALRVLLYLFERDAAIRYLTSG